MTKLKAIASLFALLVLPARASAQAVFVPAGSDWELPAPTPTPTPIGGISDKDPGSHEKLSFWDRLNRDFSREGLVEEVCRKIDIPVDFGFGVGPLSARPSYHRSIQRFPAGQLALVDEAGLSLGLSYGVPIPNFGGPGISVSFGAGLEGRSMVIRPLEHKKACEELTRLIDLRDLKTVLPMEAKRFRAMTVGEVWKAPIILRASFALGASYPIGPGAASVSFGSSRSGGMSVSLNRLAERDLRLRLRIDYAEVKGPSGGVALRVDGGDFDQYRTLSGDEVKGSLGFAGPLARSGLNGSLLNPLANFLVARLNLFAQWTKGDHALMEFVLDPENEEQMKALERLLKEGDIRVFDTLWKGTKDAALAFSNITPSLSQFRKVEERYAAALAAKSAYAAQDRATGSSLGLSLKIPFLLDLAVNSGKQRDKVTVVDGSGGHFDIYRAHHELNRGTIGVPFMGTLVRHNSRDSVVAVSRRDSRGVEEPPVVVYVQQEGFTRVMDSIVEGMVERADAVMRYAGTRGRGTNPRTSLPPGPWTRTPPPEPNEGGPQGRLYKKGVMALTITLNDRAISSLKAASAEDIVRSYINTVKDPEPRRALDWAIDHGTVRPDGWLDCDETGLAGQLRQENALRDVRFRLYIAQTLVEDLRRLRQSPNPAEKLRDIVAGSIQFSYDDVMKVLVQLVDPADLSAEFMIAADATAEKNQKGKVAGRLMIHEKNAESATVTEMNKTLGRFSPPSKLTD
ncbi:MAG: hypothetical protein HY077_07425 [Elusimicrobia bacterium]|nr:hypothetical protein [Elusimicrobiota bacterium]